MARRTSAPIVTRVLACVAAACCAVTVAAPATARSTTTVAATSAQAADTVWNDSRALALVELARRRRRLPLADTTLQNYRGRAEGFVYFYLDRRDVDRRVLIRTDQVALEVYWAQPDHTKQRIVGMRDRSSLPNRMYYHLDHLTVVQNDFGDVMRMGDGDEVRDVPHPAAPGSGAFYDFRLSDSLTIRLPGGVPPIKAYRIDVRPKNPDRPAFVGAVFVDHDNGDIVRMTFTFTPVSYVDPRLDFINISLDNSLWRGRYWLPYEQSVEIRRQVPQLDFIVSSVIQARFRIRGYDFNLDLPESLFWGYRVATVPVEEREAFEFEHDIFSDLQDAGLAPPPELKDIRAEAAQLIRDRTLSGLPRLRLSLPNASSAFRYNRAEGVYLGWGGSFRPADATRIEIVGGYAFGAAHAPLRAVYSRDVGSGGRINVEAYANRVRDIGIRPGVSGALNTLASLWSNDYLDPLHATGLSFGFDRTLNERTDITLGLRFERQRTASLEAGHGPFSDEPFRPVRTTADGDLFAARIEAGRRTAGATRTSVAGTVAVEAGCFENGFFASPTFSIDAIRESADRHASLEAGLSAGTMIGGAAPQQLFLAGGRNTIPGYAYRSFAGDAFVLTHVEAGRDLLSPFVRGRLTFTAGWTGMLDDDPTAGQQTRVPASWDASPTHGIRPSVGAGVGLGWDLLRLDLARGLGRGGEWQFLLSIDPQFWPIL